MGSRTKKRSIDRRRWGKLISETHNLKPGDLSSEDTEKLLWFIGHELNKHADVGAFPSTDVLKMSVELISYFIPKGKKFWFEDARQIVTSKASEYGIKRKGRTSHNEIFRKILRKMEEDGSIVNIRRALMKKRTAARKWENKKD